MTDDHITAWLLTLILFFIALYLNKNGKTKAFKIIHMIIRVFYLLILATGGKLLTLAPHINALYIIKVAVGLWIIALFEIILINSAKKTVVSAFWVQFVVAFLLVLYLGLKLPLGIHIF